MFTAGSGMLGISIGLNAVSDHATVRIPRVSIFILFINIHLVYRRLCRRRIHRGVRPVQYPNIGTCFMDRLDRSFLHSDFK